VKAPGVERGDSIVKKLAYVVALLCLCVSAGAQEQPAVVNTLCLKVDPAKAVEYEAFLRDTVAKGMKAMVGSGEATWFVVSRAVVPSGEAAMCDYVGAVGTSGFPASPLPNRIGVAVAKAGLQMTPEQYLAKLNTLRRQVTSSIMVTLAVTGDIAEGDYFRVNQMKIKPGKEAAWRDLESKIWAPVQAERVKAGKLKGWRSMNRMLPGGTGHPFDAITVDVYPSWAAIGQPGGLAEAVQKVHPGLTADEFGARTTAARDLVVSELRQAILVVGNTRK
jgi:hypothetical protein